MAEKTQLKPDKSILLSVVVPVHNDTPMLARLLPQLLRQAQVSQIVVCASAENQTLIDLCNVPRVTLTVAPKGRGKQLNHGADQSQGDALWFLHADATVDTNAARYIVHRLADGDDGGWFRFRFHGVDSIAAQRLARLINWRARRGVAYGDQGLFMSRSAYLANGRFRDTPLFEESSLVRELKSNARFHEAHLSIGVDPRRWQESGWIKRTLLNRALAIGHAAGIAPTTLARWYQRSR